MLRIATLLLILFWAPAFAAPVPKVKVKDVEAIQGEWKLIELLHDGKPWEQQKLVNAQATVNKGTMTVKGVRTDTDEIFAYTLDAERKQIDLRMKQPDPQYEHRGVYSLDGDTLTIAMSLGNSRERPENVKAGVGVAYLVYHRVKEEKK